MVFSLNFNKLTFFKFCFIFHFSNICAFIDPISDTASDHQAKKSIYVDEIRLSSINNVFNSSSKIVISSSEGNAFSVSAEDIDGDGDLDVLSASRNGDTVAWYENGGQSSNPTFTKRVIGTANGAMSVCAADIDGDGDMDVLSANIDENTIIFWENNGQNTFIRRVITDTVNWPTAVYAADINGDGDMDVLSASYFDNTIAWYENGGQISNPTFTKRVITTTAIEAHSVYAADIDNDGDIDIMSASFNDDTIAWYENNGQSINRTFIKRNITNTADGTFSVYAADIDNDGDLDVLSASHNDDTIAWYENGGQSTNPTFTKRVITNTADGAFSVYAVDIDKDGDIDVISASQNDDTVAWYENGGQSSSPTFTKRVITTTADSVKTVYAADLDGDGDMDVLSASGNDNTIAWYQNYRFSSLNCNTGKYQAVLNYSTSCMNCSLGKYKSEVGNYNCKSCSIGYYQNQTGQSSCKPCPINSYQDKLGQSFCSYCPIGTYNSIPGQTSLTSCVLNMTYFNDFKTKATDNLIEIKSDMVEVKSDISKIKVTLEKISTTLIKLRKKDRSKITEL